MFLDHWLAPIDTELQYDLSRIYGTAYANISRKSPETLVAGRVRPMSMLLEVWWNPFPPHITNWLAKGTMEDLLIAMKIESDVKESMLKIFEACFSDDPQKRPDILDILYLTTCESLGSCEIILPDGSRHTPSYSRGWRSQFDLLMRIRSKGLHQFSDFAPA